MDSNLDEFVQLRKQKMSKQNPILHKHVQELIATSYKDQWLDRFRLLNTKKGHPSRTYPRPP